MARTIPDRLLNRRVNVARLGGITITGSGDIVNVPARVITGVKIRIVSNKYFGSTAREMGWLVTSSHLGFINTASDVRSGDILTDQDNGKIYTVNFVNDQPGGVTTHHQEVFMTHTSYDIS